MANSTLAVMSPEQGLSRYLTEIRKFPMLTKDEEFMLAKRWSEHQDPEAAHRLVTSHLRLVAKIAMGYRGYGLRSAYMIFAMSDETFSITCSATPPEGVDKGWFMFFITLLDQLYWVGSAGLGAALGTVLPFSTEGVDFVMTAMFVVIFLNQWEKEKQHYSGIIGLAVPLVCLVLFGSGSFLLPSMACKVALAWGKASSTRWPAWLGWATKRACSRLAPGSITMAPPCSYRRRSATWRSRPCWKALRSVPTNRMPTTWPWASRSGA